MTTLFQVSFQARWADMDFNGHMKNTAFLDYAADCRMLFFIKNGYSPSNFARLRLGPVVFSDRIQYFKEVMMYESFSVTLKLKKINEDGSRHTLFNEFYRMDGTPAATVESNACWFDLSTRKITAPPDDLFTIIKNMEKTDDFTLP